jgi:hypothetical protein
MWWAGQHGKEETSGKWQEKLPPNQQNSISPALKIQEIHLS